MKEVKIDTITFVHGDNEEYMANVDMGYFHLAVVDPPYGFGADKLNMGTTAAQRKKQAESGQLKRGSHQKQSWDSLVPKKSYWDNLFRISRNQIVWGGNYFFDFLPSTDCCVVWDKKQGEDLSFDDFELAWTSFKTKSRIVTRNRGSDRKHEKIHQTQKPVYLYKWIFLNYAKRGMRVIDTHGGSHNVAIAAREYGIHLTVIEKEEEFHLKGIENYKKHTINGMLEFEDF